MQYIVVYGESVQVFEDKVNAKLKEGWKPQGGLTFTSGFFYQALVKEQ